METKIVTICGSMKYEKEMIQIAGDLEKQFGWCVIQCVYGLNKEKLTDKDINHIITAHWKKIDISDAIYVVNINGYIGNSSKNEINYALSKGKEIIYHEK